MKSKVLKSMSLSFATLLLAFVIGCGKNTTGEVKNDSTNAPAPAAAPAAPAAPATDAPKAGEPAAATPAPAAAAPALTGTVHYDAQTTGSKMKIEGTSTIHDWSMESGVLGGSLEADAKFPEGVASDASLAKITAYVFMPVRSFKSANKRMDEVMQEHMKEPDFKKIEYRLKELKLTSGNAFDSTGDLSIAGKTNTVSIPVTIEKVETSKLKVSGTIKLKMTDYGVEPPAPKIGLGLIKTGDEVTLTFEWLVAPKAP